MQQRGWRIIPVNPHAAEILGESVYRTLADIPETVRLYKVRRSEFFLSMAAFLGGSDTNVVIGKTPLPADLVAWC